jgi:hypothetical protein
MKKKAPSQSATAPVLTIATPSGGAPGVSIDGTVYALRRPSDLTVMATRRIDRLAARFGALYDKDSDLTVDEEAELHQCLVDQCVEVLDAPRGVIEALTDHGRLQIKRAFLALLTVQGQPSGVAPPSTPTTSPLPRG